MFRNHRVSDPKVAVVAIGLLLGALMPAKASAQRGGITGVITRDSSDEVLAGAEISIPQLKAITRSDSTGTFKFSDVVPGKYRIQVRLLGYNRFLEEVSVVPDAPTELRISLTSVPVNLAKVNVSGKNRSGMDPRLVEFEERARIGLGRFVHADVFEREDGRPVSSFLQKYVPGVKIVVSAGPGGARYLAGLRTVTNKPCYSRVIVNGVPRYSGFPGEPNFDLDELDTKNILGFEYYTVATTPSQFNSSTASVCGTAVIWTR